MAITHAHARLSISGLGWGFSAALVVLFVLCMLAASSIKAMIDPKDIAQLAVFLASDAAKSISGQVIPIDNDRQKA